MGTSLLERFIDGMIAAGITGQVFGEHGIGKTSTFLSYVPREHGLDVVLVPAANLTPDDLLVNAPVRDAETGELALHQLIMKQLTPGRRFVLLIDDSLQAGDTIQSQLMQVACNWTLGEHDLRALGCVGVFLTDNESAAETSARRTDLAVLDRMATLHIGANDTSWRESLVRRYPRWDLDGVFRVWAAQTPEVRKLLSPRTLQHVLDCAAEGLPMRWALPLLNGARLDLDEAILAQIATELGITDPVTVPDPVRRLLRTAIARRWAVLLQGPPGCGKTEIAKQIVREETGQDPVYFSLPVTNVEDLCVPVPAADGTLDTLLTRALLGPRPKVIVWDEYNRPKDRAAFARLMEITQEWSLAGRPIEALRAQFALQNPPYHVGRKLQVTPNNLAQASRFTASLEVGPDDIPAGQWLLDTYGRPAEAALDWWKYDLDDEGRDWVSKRTLERLIKLHLHDQPLQAGLIYLGEGEFAPVALSGLEARLAGERRVGLHELAADPAGWAARLARAVADCDEGTDDTDLVHQVFSNAEVSQLREHTAVVVQLLRHLPPKLRATYLVGQAPERQRFWIDAVKAMAAPAAGTAIPAATGSRTS
ncbi:AAA family ATPase [Dactylosporangium sp. CS-033363]|uniref:ATP-binding protein n=1 Tax=Dactylosporangium sp. CS-033363 TaxID=3239935 RepID=UPI003D9077EB